MALDTSIPLGVRPAQLEDPQAVRAKQLQLRTLQMQADQADQAAQQEKLLNNAYASSMGADGKLDRTALLGSLAQRGLGSRIPALQKQFAEGDEAQLKVDAQRFKLAKDQLDASANAISALLAAPNVTHDDVISTVAGMVQAGVMDRDRGAELVRSMPGRPEALRPWLTQKGMMVVDAAKRMELLAPKFQAVNTGKQTQFVDTNSYTNPGGPGALTMTTTPGEDLSAATARRGQDIGAATARRGQDMTAATAAAGREASASAVEKDASGNLTIVDKRTGIARPVTDARGQPINLGAGQKDASEALKLIDQAEPLLKSSTGSWAGKGLDILAAGLGYATPGSITAGKLRALEGALVSKMPKMSGPQSDKDVAMYRQMAGEIGDETVPYQRKQAALETIREIQERYAGMKPGESRGGDKVPVPKPSAAKQGGVIDWDKL